MFFNNSTNHQQQSVSAAAWSPTNGAKITSQSGDKCRAVWFPANDAKK
jgi:hypothetical protein